MTVVLIPHSRQCGAARSDGGGGVNQCSVQETGPRKDGQATRERSRLKAAAARIGRPTGAEEFEEGAGGVAQGAAGGVEEADLPLDVQLLDAHFAEQALLDFLFDTHARQEGYAGVVLHRSEERR